jgi:hypothetical protein
MLTDTETSLLGVMMMVIMLGMGASLTFKDFAIALRKPQGVGVGCSASTADAADRLSAGQGAGPAAGLCGGPDPDGLHARRHHEQHLRLLQQGHCSACPS